MRANRPRDLLLQCHHGLLVDRRSRVLTALQGIFILAGIALIIAGYNSSRPLVVVGIGLIVLAVVSRMLKRRTES